MKFGKKIDEILETAEDIKELAEEIKKQVFSEDFRSRSIPLPILRNLLRELRKNRDTTMRLTRNRFAKIKL